MSEFNPMILSGSARSDGDTAALLSSLFLSVPPVHLCDYPLSFYNYSISPDPFLPLIDRMIGSKFIIFATPVYWNTMGALLKNFLDRMTELLDPSLASKKIALCKKNVFLIVNAYKPIPKGFSAPFREISRFFNMYYRGCWVGHIEKGMRRKKSLLRHCQKCH